MIRRREFISLLGGAGGVAGGGARAAAGDAGDWISRRRSADRAFDCRLSPGPGRIRIRRRAQRSDRTRALRRSIRSTTGAGDQVRRQAALIVAITTPPTLAAKGATDTIPIVFSVADDQSASVSSPALLIRAVMLPALATCSASSGQSNSGHCASLFRRLRALDF